MELESYLQAVRIRLTADGFQLSEGDADASLSAQRRQFKPTRFGLVETTVRLSSRRESATADELRAFADESLRWALAHKSRIPRGLGSSLVVYPTLVVETASPELRAFVAGYAPKHWSALEFPVVAELSNERLGCLEKTPFWGAAYYKKTREEARELLGLKR
jgi:hypothetical protein